MGNLRTGLPTRVYSHEEAVAIIRAIIDQAGRERVVRPGLIADEAFKEELDKETNIFDSKIAPRLQLKQGVLNPDKRIIDPFPVYCVMPLYFVLRYGIKVTMLSHLLSKNEDIGLIRIAVEYGFLRDGDVIRFHEVCLDLSSADDFYEDPEYVPHEWKYYYDDKTLFDFSIGDMMYYNGIGGYDYNGHIWAIFFFKMHAGSKLIILRNYVRHKFSKEHFDSEYINVTSQDIEGGDKFNTVIFTKKTENLTSADFSY